ncbi:MAG TPA: GNAT family N-acetyltransferase, partial [Clostridia bacterium]|nr:GNAT family N-acetyltransferase [Clostridia bacterium]
VGYKKLYAFCNKMRTKGYLYAAVKGCQMDKYTYTRGNVDESILIMKEAAQWLIDKGCPLWEIDNLRAEKISENSNEYIIMWNGNESVATLVLSYQDSFFWPDIPVNTSGFIHKLAIRRKYAGAELARMLVQYAIDECKRNGINQVRVDCDNRNQLCEFYEKIGFRQKENRKIGRYSVAFYEYFNL